MNAVADLKLLSDTEPRNVMVEWILRIGVSVFFGIFGLEKFSETPGSHWVQLFHEIGLGDWFRYVAGAVEILGAGLVLIPRATIAGLMVLALTMGSAAGIVAFALKRPGEAAFPGMFLLALIGVMLWYRGHVEGR
jgi:uncharacterized membrane protein YphA (DoxX/SURF4 family)